MNWNMSGYRDGSNVVRSWNSLEVNFDVGGQNRIGVGLFGVRVNSKAISILDAVDWFCEPPGFTSASGLASSRAVACGLTLIGPAARPSIFFGQSFCRRPHKLVGIRDVGAFRGDDRACPLSG